jgi:hypothetical protein
MAGGLILEITGSDKNAAEKEKHIYRHCARVGEKENFPDRLSPAPRGMQSEGMTKYHRYRSDYSNQVEVIFTSGKNVVERYQCWIL